MDEEVEELEELEESELRGGGSKAKETMKG